MSKKLTAQQRMARATIKAAAEKLIAELDETMTGGRYPFRSDCAEFVAHFHLDCIKPKPRENLPIYRYAVSR